MNLLSLTILSFFGLAVLLGLGVITYGLLFSKKPRGMRSVPVEQDTDTGYEQDALRTQPFRDPVQ
jgi:hypothetical protein